MKSLESLDDAKPFFEEGVYGCLHSPGLQNPAGGVVLTHGAGADFNAPALAAVASGLAKRGFYVLRCNMAFRQRRPKGPPHPSAAGEDRASLRLAVDAMRKITPGRMVLGGHSYGGRQATMLAAEEATVADSLLLLSYPLHPPLKPAMMRTAHFGSLQVSCLFVHGTKDGFGTVDEMRAALSLIPAQTELSVIEGAGHDLARGRFDIQDRIVAKLK